MSFTGLPGHTALRTVVRVHVFAWRKDDALVLTEDTIGK